MGILFSIDQFDVSEIQVLLIIDVNVRKNYTSGKLQPNKTSDVVSLISALWVCFSIACGSLCIRPSSQFNALPRPPQDLHPDQHPEKKRRVGLRDTERCTPPLPPHSVPCPITAAPCPLSLCLSLTLSLSFSISLSFSHSLSSFLGCNAVKSPSDFP